MQMMCQVRDVSSCGAGITYRKEDENGSQKKEDGRYADAGRS